MDELLQRWRHAGSDDRGVRQTVQIACKIAGFTVADGNTWWYQIASTPWNGAYYVSADAFYNNGADLRQPSSAHRSSTRTCRLHGLKPTATAACSDVGRDRRRGHAHVDELHQRRAAMQGPSIATNQTVQIACKVTGFRVADGNTWWYRIASARGTAPTTPPRTRSTTTGRPPAAFSAHRSSTQQLRTARRPVRGRLARRRVGPLTPGRTIRMRALARGRRSRPTRPFRSTAGWMASWYRTAIRGGMRSRHRRGTTSTTCRLTPSTTTARLRGACRGLRGSMLPCRSASAITKRPSIARPMARLTRLRTRRGACRATRSTARAGTSGRRLPMSRSPVADLA